MFEAARFGLDVQTVIALRLARIAAGGATGAAEAQRMVLEKALAAAKAQAAAATALMLGGKPETALKMAYRPYRSAVRANRRRLSRSAPRAASRR
jgi:ribosomal protein S9